jgi:hypothetical protein
MPFRSPLRAIALGGLTVGVLDGLDAIIFFGLRGVGPTRIFQAIAAGLLGPQSFQGGFPTAALGVLLHYTIATLIVAVAFEIARRIPALTTQPILVGACYGVGVWLVMNFVVVPLSAANQGPRPAAVLINGILIHILGVGIPAWLFASRSEKGEARSVTQR